MLRFLVRRFFLGLLVLFLVSLAVFFMFFKLNASGPNAVASRLCGKQCSVQQINAVKERLHLNDPFLKQYYYFLFGYPGKGVQGGAPRNRGLLHGDLGYSYVNEQSVNGLLKDAFPITLSLAAGSAVLWLFMGLFSGILSAIRPRSMTTDGALRRIRRIGSNDCPPPRTLASSPCSARAASASATEVGAR